eukprot:CAMPEP_0184386214 /NCGR_PEP_ID=MMETSP0007-20130409/9589_1 /TAXON_ID=97485 /ORGANISM="Prymnesium parvum, Strain Texoma1" /LENGTH=88 /DNA_ID=CAMNT_0026733965 /DNA_START=126 /DNA_END=387 /DNA_ORIENTATION=-
MTSPLNKSFGASTTGAAAVWARVRHQQQPAELRCHSLQCPPRAGGDAHRAVPLEALQQKGLSADAALGEVEQEAVSGASGVAPVACEV